MAGGQAFSAGAARSLYRLTALQLERHPEEIQLGFPHPVQDF